MEILLSRVEFTYSSVEEKDRSRKEKGNEWEIIKFKIKEKIRQNSTMNKKKNLIKKNVYQVKEKLQTFSMNQQLLLSIAFIQSRWGIKDSGSTLPL